MQRLHFCSGMVFTTGDAISTAVLRYVQAVAMTGRSDVVTVPVVGSGPSSREVTLLVNRASQISAESIESDGSELLDDAFVEHLVRLRDDLLEPAIWDGSDPRFAVPELHD